MTIPYLPTEIFEQIVTHLSSMKLWRFDDARKQDLQSLRLVSHRIKNVATPLLFQNLRTNAAGLLTLTLFCASHPEFASYIHGLQLVIILVPIDHLLRELHGDAARMMKEADSQGEEHARMLFDIIIEPYQKLLDNFPEFKREPPILEQYLHETSQSLLALAKALPNLKHFETTSSKSWSTFFTNAEEKFHSRTGRMVPGLELVDEFQARETEYAGYLGIKLATRCKMAQSYKCEYLGLLASSIMTDPEATESEFFSNLHTLDLGFQVGTLTGIESKRSARRWIPPLNRLPNLSTLRLVLTECMQDVHATPNRDRYKLLLDDFFLHYEEVPNDQDDGHPLQLKAKCQFPKLKSVTLKNWVVTTSALHYFLYAHRNTLKRVDMEQVSLRIPYKEDGHEQSFQGDRRGWSFIARACQKHLSGLEDLRLSKLYTHEKIDLDPTPPPGDMAVVVVRKLHTGDYADLHRVAFNEPGDGESGVGSKVKEVTEPVDPKTERWWPK